MLKLDIEGEDFDALRDGDLLAVRDRYEDRRTDPSREDLNDQELAILCDIYVRHVSISKASACLDDLEARPAARQSEKTAAAIQGKRALLEYLQGHYDRAADLSREVESDGGRYVHALAEIKLGDDAFAVAQAEEWRLSYKPAQVFLAANLYLATERYADVLAILQEPERRLDRDYNLSGTSDVFGTHIDPAPLRIDLFGEFGFGLLDTFTYAPRGNVYVEYALAKSELELDKIESARRRYDLILDFPWISAYRDVHWLALADRGRIAELDGNIDDAIRYYQESVDVIESARASITTDAGRIGFVGDKQEVYGDLMRLLLEQGDTVSAFEYSERARARSLVDLLASVEEFGPRGLPKPEQDALISSYEQAAIEQTEAQDEDPTEVEARTRGLTEEARRVFNRLAPQVGVLVTVAPLTLEGLRPSLLPEEALLSYVEHQGAWGVFVVTREGAVSYTPLNEATDADGQVIAFRAAIKAGSGYESLTRDLYEELLEPVRDRIPSHVTSLTIVPTSTLHYLPFAALRGPEPDGRYLIEDYALSILPSAQVKNFLVPEPYSSDVLALGNPTRDPPRPLPGAEVEAVRVANLAHSPTPPLIGPAATKSQFLQLASGQGVLHIASHAEFNPQAPLQSRLLLAPDSRSGDLTVEDLFVDVSEPWGARVAVLSACETAVPKVEPGDDLVGLERGFLYAGVDSIVGTLWQIPDNGATLLLMEKFYTALNRGASGAEALQFAQTQTMKSYPAPADWAAFTFVGLQQDLPRVESLSVASAPDSGRQ